MTYRPYPNAVRALRQIHRHTPTPEPRQPSELELRMARQARAALDAMGAAVRPLMEGLAQIGAPHGATPRP